MRSSKRMDAPCTQRIDYGGGELSFGGSLWCLMSGFILGHNLFYGASHTPLTGNACLNARSRSRARVINSHANLQARPRRKKVFNPGRPGLS